jgi:hypothetical protein
MWIRHGRIQPFDATNPDQVMRNLLRPEVLMRSYPSKIAERWRRAVPEALFRVFFFDDLKRGPAEVRHAIIDFLGGDPGKSSGDLAVDHNAKARLEKLELTEEVRAHLAKFFEEELKSCANELGGAAVEWPGRYGF